MVQIIPIRPAPQNISQEWFLTASQYSHMKRRSSPSLNECQPSRNVSMFFLAPMVLSRERQVYRPSHPQSKLGHYRKAEQNGGLPTPRHALRSVQEGAASRTASAHPATRVRLTE